MSTTTLPDQLSDSARQFASSEHQLLIDGERVPAADGRTFQTLDPATGNPIADVAHAGPEDIDRAVNAARRALEEGPWSPAPAAERALCLNRLAVAVAAHADALADLAAMDNGKPAKLAQNAEVRPTPDALRDC